MNTGATPPEPDIAAAQSLRVWTFAMLLAVVTAFTYWPAVQCGFLNLDDNVYVTESPHVKAGLTIAGKVWAFTHSVSSNWHPLTLLSYMWDAQLYGTKAWGFHLTNIFFHAVNAGLLFLLLWVMTRALWRSFFVAALFALHPLRVESEAWVAERKDVLSGFFGFLALITYVLYSRRRDLASGKNKSFIRCRFYLLSLVLFVCGLMSKPMLVTWPFVMLLLDWWPLQRFRFLAGKTLPSNLWPLVIEKTPFFAAVAASSLVTFLVQKNTGAVVGWQYMPVGDRIGNAIISYCRYIGLTFWPADLSIIYPHPGHWPLIAVLLAAALLSSISVFVFRTRRPIPFMFTGWFWHLGTLVPVIGLVQVGSQAMADRYTYLPSVGLFILIVWGLHAIVQNAPLLNAVLAATCSLVIIACVLLTRHQLGYWFSSETVFRHALAVTEGNFLAHSSLGSALTAAGRNEEAMEQYDASLRIAPTFANSHYGRGLSLAKEGHPMEAVDAFEAALRCSPGYSPAQADLGIALIKIGRPAEARMHLEEALRLNPELAPAHNGLGTLLSNEGLPDQAIAEFQKAIGLNPYFAEAHYNLALSLALFGRPDQAIAELEDTIRLDPTLAEAQNNLGLLLGGKGRVGEAAQHFAEAIRLKPDFADAHNNLGTALAIQGRSAEAIKEFRESLRLNPASQNAKQNLQRAFSTPPR